MKLLKKKGYIIHVLIVDWYSPYVTTMELMLRSEGFSFYTTAFGEEAIDLAKTEDYDIILLELHLPDMSGIDVVRSIRLAQIDVPIMIVTGSTEIDLKVKSFGGGADDYLCKPFHKDELICRIHALIRRSKGLSQSVIKTGEISLNLDTRTVEILGTKVNLTSTEYQMLEFLSLRKGTTLTKEMFLDYLYHGIGEPEVKTIDVFICKLRKKLANANITNGNHYIETVWGRGYVLRDPEHSRAETAA